MFSTPLCFVEIRCVPARQADARPGPGSSPRPGKKVDHVKFLVLGSAAGGGLPQWNCLCENCRLAYARDSRITQRSQCSVAVSADGENWVVLSATPDLRQQIIANPALHPKIAPRHSPIKAVFAPNGDVDNIAGLLVMREMQPFTLWATKSVMANTHRRRVRRAQRRRCQARDRRARAGHRHRTRLHADAFRDAGQNSALYGIAPMRPRSNWAPRATPRSASKSARATGASITCPPARA